MHKGYLRTAAILAAITVALGAFGAHKLKELVSDEAVAIFDTGVRYQFYHVLALFITGILFKDHPNKLIRFAGVFFLLGMLFFSGSLYILTYKTAIVSPGFSWAGPVTPIGGLCFIIGWILLAMGIKRKLIS